MPVYQAPVEPDDSQPGPPGQRALHHGGGVDECPAREVRTDGSDFVHQLVAAAFEHLVIVPSAGVPRYACRIGGFLSIRRGVADGEAYHATGARHECFRRASFVEISLHVAHRGMPPPPQPLTESGRRLARRSGGDPHQVEPAPACEVLDRLGELLLGAHARSVPRCLPFRPGLIHPGAPSPSAGVARSVTP